MSRKYLVFISSARDDLKTERRELIRIVSEMGMLPLVTDVFDITQEEDRAIIQKSIEECDYFLNLTAHMGGKSVGKYSALELEYTWAVKAEIPVLSLIISGKARRKASKKEKDSAAIKALESFKKKLECHAHDSWTNLGDLKQKAILLLNREINLNPGRGWVPADEAAAPLALNELGKLIRENKSLRRKIKMGEPCLGKKFREEVKHTLRVLASNRISLSFYYIDGENWENSKNFRYLRLFKLLAPELSAPKTTADISHFLGNILNPDLGKVVRKDFPAPSNTVKKIMTDFTLLKLVEGDGEAWEMTEYGNETFAAFRLRQMNRARETKKSGSEKPAAGQSSRDGPKSGKPDELDKIEEFV